jgi:hypothetical protein
VLRATTLSVALLTSRVQAAWTSVALPPLSQNFGSYRMGHLTDGSLVYGSNNDLDLQQGGIASSVFGDYTNALPWDPSSVAIFSNTLGAIGQGTFGASAIYTFNPSNLATPFTPIPGVSIQNYSVAFRDATSLYIGGNNGSASNGFGVQQHAISYVKLDGSANKRIIDNISLFSGDFAVDIAGNLYVSDNDDLKLYKFTPLQLTTAILGSPLSITDGQFIATLNKNGSLAVDAKGRIWSAGFQTIGIDMFDPAAGKTTTFVPALSNSDYTVATFSTASDDYVAFINASGSGAGSTLTYGIETTRNLIPEPAAGALLLFGLGTFAAHRRRTPR